MGKDAVVGMKDRQTGQMVAEHVYSTDKNTLQDFVLENTIDGAIIYTDEMRSYIGLINHETVRHSAKEYVHGMAHTQGIESFWAMLKRGYVGTYHQMSTKHLHRYVTEFKGRHNHRPMDTEDQMMAIAQLMEGKRLRYAYLIAK